MIVYDDIYVNFVMDQIHLIVYYKWTRNVRVCILELRF